MDCTILYKMGSIQIEWHGVYIWDRKRPLNSWHYEQKPPQKTAVQFYFHNTLNIEDTPTFYWTTDVGETLFFCTYVTISINSVPVHFF